MTGRSATSSFSTVSAGLAGLAGRTKRALGRQADLSYHGADLAATFSLIQYKMSLKGR